MSQDPATSQLRKRTRRAARSNPDGQLSIRWFTPRGRAALGELLEDLLHGDGLHVGEIVADLRRPGAHEGAVDLRGIDLRGLELAHAQLQGADLRGARLAGANLMRANLEGADLSRAVLRDAKLRGATLRKALLERADLREADLSDTNLEEANLKGAKMRGAEIKRAWVRGVDFEQAFAEDVDFSLVRRKAYKAPASTLRLRGGIGAPPVCEPVPVTQRFKKPLRPRPELGTISPQGIRRGRREPPPVPQSLAPVAPSTPTLDAALAQILLRRPEVDRIVVTLGGEEVVLFDRQGQLREVA